MNQNAADTGKTPESQFYTYNNQNSDGDETVQKVSDGLLALFTLALVIVSWMQWSVLRKHEESLVKLAQAASDNAKALVNSERAWVTVFLEWATNDSSRVKFPDNRTELLVNLVCANRGHAPAWIVERTIKAEIADGFYGPDLTNVNDSEVDRSLIPLAPTGVNGYRDDWRRRLDAQGLPRNKFVLIYGVVRYRDAFTPKGELRETWFGYYTTETIDPLARIPQAEYNQHT